MKKTVLLFLVLSLIFLCACSTVKYEEHQFTLTSFESQISIDGGDLIGRLNYVSADEITLTVDYPEEIRGLAFKQNTFGTDVSFEGTEINEFQSELFGFNLSPVEELFEYLSSLSENNFTLDADGGFSTETNYDNIKVKVDLNENHIVSIESENHQFDFTVN